MPDQGLKCRAGWRRWRATNSALMLGKPMASASMAPVRRSHPSRQAASPVSLAQRVPLWRHR